jgi:hypothetical protein
MRRLTALLVLVAVASSGTADTPSSGPAGDRLVLTIVAPYPAPGQENLRLPGPYTLSGSKFKELQRDVEAVVAQLGKKTEWWDTGPDASYESLEIYFQGKRYVLNSWYPMFRDSQTAAVSERLGIVAVTGAAEKRRVEDANSARYRTLVGLFAKVRASLKQEAR